jgi:hypothetical protein
LKQSAGKEPPGLHPNAAIILLQVGIRERRVDVVELQEFARLYGKPLDFFVN